MSIALRSRQALVALAVAAALTGGVAAVPDQAAAAYQTCEELEQLIAYHEYEARQNYLAGNTANGDKHTMKADAYIGQYENNCT